MYDPRTQLNDALGMFTPLLPDSDQAKAARILCRTDANKVGWGRVWRTEDVAGYQATVVLHPTEHVIPVTGMKVPRYLVILSSFSHTWVKKEGRKRIPIPIYNHDSVFHAVDEAEAFEVAHQVLNAWRCDREQDEEGRGIEIPFSPQWMDSAIESGRYQAIA